jgi:hypothetical protein
MSNGKKTMQVGEYQWDTDKELRTRCKLSLRLDGFKIFSSGKTPLACATLMPDGETLDITMFIDRVAKENAKKHRGLVTYHINCGCSSYNWTRRPMRGAFLRCKGCGKLVGDMGVNLVKSPT